MYFLHIRFTSHIVTATKRTTIGTLLVTCLNKKKATGEYSGGHND